MFDSDDRTARAGCGSPPLTPQAAEWLFLPTGCDAPSGNLGTAQPLSSSKRLEACAIPPAVLVPCCGLPLRRAKFPGIPTEFGGKWELCVLKKSNSPLRRKLSTGLCLFC